MKHPSVLYTGLLLLLLFQRCCTGLAQEITHIYQFNNSLSESGLHCGPALLQAKALGSCSPSSSPGLFLTDSISACAAKKTVYHNSMSWGLQYPNTTGVITGTYTIHLYAKTTDFGVKTWARIIDFSNGLSDNGIYFIRSAAPVDRCLDFYPNSTVGTCPYFNDTTYYLLTFTRNNATGIIDVYVNSVLFSSYNDAAGLYKGVAGVPIYIYRDDKAITCESGEANFAYLSFGNTYSTLADVQKVFKSICPLSNTSVSDFSVSLPSTCHLNQNVTVTYTGSVPPPGAGYTFAWDWDGGTVVSGSGMGPFVVNWNTTGTKNIALTVTTGLCTTETITNNVPVTVHNMRFSVSAKPATCSNAANGLIELSASGGTPPYQYSIDGQNYKSTGTFTTAPGTFSAFVKDAGDCSEATSVTVGYTDNSSPWLSVLGNDTAICKGDSLTAKVPLAGVSLRWQDGSSADTLLIRNEGRYWVDMTVDGCTYRDTLLVSFKNEPPAFPIKDTIICENSSLSLDISGTGDSYLWEDNTTGPVYHTAHAGRIKVSITREGCTYADSIRVGIRPLPNPQLGPDRELCPDERLILPADPGINHTWQDGSAAPSYTVTVPGIYSLTETNSCGSRSDTLEIKQVNCLVELPNAFTPNQDGDNDIFKVLHPGNIKEFSMIIYDRWGKELFVSRNVNTGWDGRTNGRMQQPGTYAWFVQYIDSNGKKRIRSGTLILIR